MNIWYLRQVKGTINKIYDPGKKKMYILLNQVIKPSERTDVYHILLQQQ